MYDLKKIAAILFVSVLAFNWFGYRFVIGYLENQHQQQLLSQFDNEDYNDADLISIKAPFSLPYAYMKKDQFERWDGQIEINGIQYKYVKRRFFKDSIEILCLPDYKAMALENARDNFFRYANDLLQHQPTKKSNNHPAPSYKNLLSEYCQQVTEWNFGIESLTYTHHSRYAHYKTADVDDNVGQPPDVA